MVPFVGVVGAGLWVFLVSYSCVHVVWWRGCVCVRITNPIFRLHNAQKWLVMKLKGAL